MYFVSNSLVFDGIIPVSGAIKQRKSQQVWDRAGEYDLVQHFSSFVSFWPFDNETPDIPRSLRLSSPGQGYAGSFPEPRSLAHVGIWYEWEISSHAGTLIMNPLLPEGSAVSSSDAGVIGYFSRHPVVNLDGLVNSYDFFRERLMTPSFNFGQVGPQFFRELGVTHYATATSIRKGPDGTLFEGEHFFHKRFRRFRLISIGASKGIEDALNRRVSFWERIEPYFDYRFQSEPIGIIIDGRLALSIARDCTPAERVIILQYTIGDGETATAP